MIQIRKGVFETNSSSCHAIAIPSEPDVKLHFPEKVEFRFGEFGWEEREYNDVKNKANYLYTCLSYLFENHFDTFKKYIQFIVDTLYENDVECEFVDTIDISISVSTFYKGKKPEAYIYGSIDGYVDHGDEAKDFVDAVCTDKSLLLAYLFSKDSVIKTGNDNDDSDVTIISDVPVREFYKGN